MEYDYVTEIGEFTDMGGSVDNAAMTNMMSALGTYSVVIMLLSLLLIVEMWLIFKKNGKPGWAAIVPIYNIWTLFTICDLPGWLCLIPVANGIGMLISYFKLPKKMGKSAAFGLGCLFLPFIFFGILAFSKNKNQESELKSEEVNVPEVPTGISENVIPETSDGDGAPDLISVTSAPVNDDINVVEPEKQFTPEEPALNMASEQPVESIPIVNEPVVEQNAIPVVDTVNAFDMPTPVNNTEINEINNASEVTSPVVEEQVSQPMVETVMSTAGSTEIPVIEEPVVNDLNAVANNEPVVDLMSDPENNNSEETLEIPQMTNTAINEDITVTKKCPNCGTENPYVNKTCQNCGNTLE